MKQMENSERRAGNETPRKEKERQKRKKKSEVHFFPFALSERLFFSPFSHFLFCLIRPFFDSFGSSKQQQIQSSIK